MKIYAKLIMSKQKKTHSLPYWIKSTMTQNLFSQQVSKTLNLIHLAHLPKPAELVAPDTTEAESSSN